MSQLAVGIIETIGLAACIEAADVCVKSANVKLIGYEFTKGSGMAVLKVEGDVGAVKAAIEAGIVAANKVNKVFSYKVIPRPSDYIEKLIKNEDTVGYIKETPTDLQPEEVIQVNEIDSDTEISVISDETKETEIIEKSEEDYTCNICRDPACSRQKGELKTNCIHYNELHNDLKDD